MWKEITKILMHFPENCIFVKIVTSGGRQLLEQPKYYGTWMNIKLCLWGSVSSFLSMLIFFFHLIRIMFPTLYLVFFPRTLWCFNKCEVVFMGLYSFLPFFSFCFVFCTILSQLPCTRCNFELATIQRYTPNLYRFHLHNGYITQRWL